MRLELPNEWCTMFRNKRVRVVDTVTFVNNILFYIMKISQRDMTRVRLTITFDRSPRPSYYVFQSQSAR